MLTRQQRRSAERRLKQDKFPWPELHGWLIRYLRKHSEFFCQTTENKIEVFTNLEGEPKVYSIEEFYILLRKLMEENPEGE